MFKRFVIFFATSLTFAFAQVSLQEMRDFKFAYSLFEDGMYQLAFSEFQKFIKNYPESKFVEEARFFSAESMFKLGEYDSALKIYFSLLSDIPNTRFKDKANYRIAEIYFRRKNYAPAIENFKKAIETSSDKLLISQSAYYLGEIYFEQNDFRNALRYYTLSYEVDTTGEVAPYAIFSVGFILQRQEKFQEAIEKYETLIEKFGEKSGKYDKILNDARLNLVECYYKLRNYRKAIKSALELAKKSEDERIIFLLGESYYALGLYDSARFYYESYLKKFPSGEFKRHAVYSIGWVYYKQGKHREAIQIFDSLSRGNDAIANLSLFYLGEVKKASGDTSEAISVFKNFIQRDKDYSPLNARANYELGLIYFSQGKYDSAIVYLEKIRLDDTSDVKMKAFELLAQSYIRRGNYSKGASVLRMVRNEFKLSPESESINIYSEGVALMQAGEFREAIGVFEEFLSKFPNDINAEWAILYLGEIYYKLGDYKNARKYYNEILKRFPRSANAEQALYSIAWSYFKEGNYSESAKQFEKFLNTYSTGKRALDARLRLGDCYFMMKNYKQAESVYLSFVRLFGNQEGADYAYFQLSQVYLRQRQLMRSLEMLNLLLNRFPNSTLAPSAKYQIGWIYFQDKNYTPAINSFREVVDKYPNSDLAPRALYGIGDAYYNMGKYDLAIKAYLEVIEKYPESKYAGDAISGIQYSLSAQGKNPNLVDELISKSKNPDFLEIASLKKAEFQISQGNYAEGINLYKKFIANYPQSKFLPKAYYEIGRTYEIMGRNFEAVEVYKNLIAMYPLSEFSQNALVRLGWIKFNSGEFAEAIEHLGKVETKAKFYDEVVYLMGLNYLSLGDTSSAMRKFNDVINQFPNSDFSDRARVKIGEILLSYDKSNEAIEILKPVVLNRATDEVSAQAQYLYAESFFKLGNFDEALLQFLRVRYLYGEYVKFLPMTYYRIAQCYEIKGDYGKATQFLNDILKMNINAEMKTRVLEKLEQLKTKITG
ncbi:MAG: outer membrane protein assembly factor BamD [Candidatus Kryptonium sp.]|nr:tetratricopeptide repeat protein [Candidatus Kryptonium sp.]MDW8108214.1 outer membrane protein assembly factor BamD [Candidatus Kryptonium sp.]